MALLLFNITTACTPHLRKLFATTWLISNILIYLKFKLVCLNGNKMSERKNKNKSEIQKQRPNTPQSVVSIWPLISLDKMFIFFLGCCCCFFQYVIHPGIRECGTYALQWRVCVQWNTRDSTEIATQQYKIEKHLTTTDGEMLLGQLKRGKYTNQTAHEYSQTCVCLNTTA